jgi:hypothetical protein
MQAVSKSIIWQKILTMSYVVAVTAVCPMRSDASHKSEMVSQLLFGEAAELLDSGKDFTRIKCLYDGYEGWCAKNQLAPAEDTTPFKPVAYVDMRHAEAMLNDTIVPLPLGAPVFADVAFGSYTISFHGQQAGQQWLQLPPQERVRLIAYQYINTPYLWGGKSNFGIDCSGFTQQVFKLLHKPLLRDAYQQATQGEAVGFLQEVQCGDLAFFDNDEGRITHTGILLNSETIIHAAGYVRVDRIDNAGIIHSYTGKRTHKLRIIKRVL